MANRSPAPRPGHEDSDDVLSERTPLLHGNGHNGKTASQQGRPRSQRSESDDGAGGSDSSGDGNSVSTVRDLGDFALQPPTLAQAVSEKNVSKILEALEAGHGDSVADPSEVVGKLAQALQTDFKSGLAEDQTSEEGASERIRVYGRNALPERTLKSFWRFLWEAFCDKVLIILTVAAAVSFALGMYQDFGPQHDPSKPRVNWVEGVAIMAAIVIVTVTSSVNDYSKERQFKALNAKKEVPRVKVLRDGQRYKSVKASELLVGDVVHLEAGDILSCDGIVIDSHHDIKVDESDATGESDAISKLTLSKVLENQQGHEEDSQRDKKKRKGDPVLLSGSKVLEGRGHYVVVAVGPASFQGKIFMSLRSSQPDQTRMQKQLADLAEKIAKVASFAGALLFLALFIRNCVELKTKPDRSPAEKGQSFIQAFVISVTLIVVAVPEGLPLAVTLALAFATNRMTSHNLLVRVFEACETMSNANVIVTDKTGTLTANEMRVVEGTIGGVAFTLRDEKRNSSEHNAEEEGQASPKDVCDKSSIIDKLRDDKTLLDILVQSVCVNSTAFEEHEKQDAEGSSQRQNPPGQNSRAVGNGNGTKDGQSSRDPKTTGQSPRFVGNKTESALLRMLAVDLKELNNPNYAKVREEAQIVTMLPLSSDRKAMATAIKLQNGGYRLHIKGAAEVIAGLCTKRAHLEGDEGNDTEDLDEQGRKDLEELVESYAKRALRTIALAYRDYEEWPPRGAGTEGDAVKYGDIAKDLVLLAIPAIEDPLRPGVANAVDKCRTAGVSVKMCTGDNILTAQAIAKECGIYKDGLVISGADWRKLSDEEKREKAMKIEVMARSLPQDKESLVKCLQDVEQITGVTGDGTNDALALKVADVGFSMGQAGTEVAKEASDVIIMDDNFASLVGAITWGRCVSDAVRKFLQFQLAVNATAIVITFASSVTGGDENSVMNAVQLLWVNLIMDTFAALALATDPADDSLLQRKPEPRSSPIITVPMTKMIVLQALYQIAITLTLHFIGPKALKSITSGGTPSETAFNTLVFNIFVWCQIFNMINCRQLGNHFNVFKGMHRNPWLLGILAIMIGGQILIVFVGGAAFGTEPIPIQYWAVSIAFGAGSLVVGALARLIPDAPLGQALIALRIMPDVDSLPRSRPKQEDEDQSDQLHRVESFIRRIKGGRSKANGNLYRWLHAQDDEQGKVIKGLFLLPAVTAAARVFPNKQGQLS